MLNATPKGFTLIELMITVTIIAILAGVALPAYQDYTIRSQVMEGMTLGGGARTAVAEAYASTGGSIAADNVAAGLAAPTDITGKYVGSVTVTTGGISVAFSSTSPRRANAYLDGKTLDFSPLFTSSSGALVWECSSSTIDQRFLPTICRDGTN
jgi:type IV pilus assembly protein PilA